MAVGGTLTTAGTITTTGAAKVASAGNVETNGQLVSFVATGTAPLAVTSTTKVTNLNADQTDGFHAGNSSGQIPVSNGTVNTNLNADKCDGLDVGHLSGNIPWSEPGVNNAGLDADTLDGFHAGNLTGQVPISNGTVNTNLNAEYVQNNHVSDLVARANHTGTQAASTIVWPNALSDGMPDATITTSYQDTGMSVTADRTGKWVVWVFSDFLYVPGDGDANAAMTVKLVVNGVDQVGTTNGRAPSSAAGKDIEQVMNVWHVTGVTSGHVIKAQVIKSGGTGATKLTSNSYMVAMWAGT